MHYQSNRDFVPYLLFFYMIQVLQGDSFKCVQDGFFPDKHDCWIYHICVGTTHSVKACKEDLLFNPLKNECDWAMNVNCSNSSSDGTLVTPDMPVAVDLSYRVTPFANENPSKNKHSPATSDSIFDYLCRSVDNDYIAHPTDCKRYAYCANSLPQPKMCTKSLLWSQAEKMCVWPVQSDCPVKNQPPAPSESSGDAPWMPRATTYPSSYILTDASPALPSSHVYKPSVPCPLSQTWRVPDPYDCSTYHDCYHGTDLVSYCPAQLHYNPQRQSCDHARNVPCKNKCTAKNEGARFVDMASCCHFFECISGKLIPQTCSHPKLFDIHTRTCAPYRQVKCDGRRQCLSKCHYLSNYEAGKSLCDFVPSCAGHSNGFYLDRGKPNCQSYIQCLDNRVANQSRCPHSQRFNRNMGRCTPADQVPCRASPSVRLSWLLCLFVIGPYYDL